MKSTERPNLFPLFVLFQDLQTNVKKIAEFLDISLTEEQIQRITKANTFENKKKEQGKGNIIYRSGK